MADYDVVVVRAGAARLCAAVTAAEAGASVLVAEASDTAGGASQFSAGLIMAAGTRFQRERASKTARKRSCTNTWPSTAGRWRPGWRAGSPKRPGRPWNGSLTAGWE